jgi:hypothetical protein
MRWIPDSVHLNDPEVRPGFGRREVDIPTIVGKVFAGPLGPLHNDNLGILAQFLPAELPQFCGVAQAIEVQVDQVDSRPRGIPEEEVEGR